MTEAKKILIQRIDSSIIPDSDLYEKIVDGISNSPSWVVNSILNDLKNTSANGIELFIKDVVRNEGNQISYKMFHGVSFDLS